MILILKGQVPSQKNSKQIFRNSKTGAPFITSNSRVKDWQKDVALQLRYQAVAFPDKVEITYNFYCKDNRRRDLDNMVASVNDALVAAGVITDDSWQVLSIAGAIGYYDKENPRVTLKIDEV